MKLSEATREAIAIHQAAGRQFEAGGVGSFVREQGQRRDRGPRPRGPDLLLPLSQDGPVPSQDEGLHAVAFDFPGLGLADRPDDFDYSWTGLANWMGEAIDALDIDRCHLVVHDIGGPIGFEWAVKNPDRVAVDDRAQHFPRRRDLPAALADAAVRDPRDRRGVAGDAAAVVRQLELFYLEGSRTAPRCRAHEVYAHIARC